MSSKVDRSLALGLQRVGRAPSLQIQNFEWAPSRGKRGARNHLLLKLGVVDATSSSMRQANQANDEMGLVELKLSP